MKELEKYYKLIRPKSLKGQFNLVGADARSALRPDGELLTTPLRAVTLHLTEQNEVKYADAMDYDHH